MKIETRAGFGDCERRFSAHPSCQKLTVRAEGESQYPNIVGYGAVFHDPGDPGTEYRLFDDFVERIMPTAFDKAMERKDDCFCFFNHNPDIVLGRTTAGTMKLRVDRKGLLYEVDPPESPKGKDVTLAVARGDCTGSSFMFYVDEEVLRIERKDDREILIREITSVTLLECGPVCMPAYSSTTADLSRKSRSALEEFRSKVAKTESRGLSLSLADRQIQLMGR